MHLHTHTHTHLGVCQAVSVGSTTSAPHGWKLGLTPSRFTPSLFFMPLRVATECSGLEPLPYVLDAVGFSGHYELVWACERDLNCQLLIHASHRDKARFPEIHPDITTRLPNQIPDHDLYVAGFPCQPFSAMGLRQGVRDPQGRGTIIEHIIAALMEKTPAAFILENVRGLVSQHREDFDRILKALRSMRNNMYLVAWRVLNTEHHGIPQHRDRVYMVGIRRDMHGRFGKFSWPHRIPALPLTQFLKEECPIAPATNRLRRVRRFAKLSPRGVRKRLAQGWRRARRRGISLLNVDRPVIIDVDGFKGTYMVGRCPCITRSRGGTRFFVAPYGRRLYVSELLRLQGLPVSILKHSRKCGISDSKLGQMVGNAMSCNILERLLARILPVVGLLPPGVRLHDRWAAASRQHTRIQCSP